MKKLLLVIPLLLLFCLLGHTPRLGVAVGQQPDARPKWEYKALQRGEIEDQAPKESKHRLTDGLNKLGDEGWELVAVEPATVYSGPRVGAPIPPTYLFKRPKR